MTTAVKSRTIKARATAVKAEPKHAAKSRVKVASMRAASTAAPERVAADFNESAKAAAAMLERCGNVADVRGMWRAYIGVLGHKALGRVLLYGADFAISKHKTA